MKALLARKIFETDLPSGQTLVLLAIDYLLSCGEEPTLIRLADRTGYSIRHTARLLDELKAAEIILGDPISLIDLSKARSKPPFQEGGE